MIDRINNEGQEIILLEELIKCDAEKQLGEGYIKLIQKEIFDK
jgi:hypothetical protein